MKKKYDIFISYSRKDYVNNNGNIIPENPVSKIQRVLEANGISYWFDKKGIYSSSEFMPVLIDAIENSNIVVFVSSKHSNESNWTAGEILEAHDQGKSIIPFKIDDSRYGKSFRIALRPLDFIDYTENPQHALDNLVRSINIIKERIAEKEKLETEEREKREALERKKIIKEEILQSILPDYQRLDRQLGEIHQQMLDKKIYIGEGFKSCPVCNKEQSISALFCNRCGTPFPPLYGIDSLCKIDTLQLNLQKSVWKACSNEIKLNKTIKKLETDKDALASQIENLTCSLNQIQEVSKENAVKLREENKTLSERIKIVTLELENAKIDYEKKLSERDNEILHISESLQREQQQLEYLKQENHRISTEKEEIQIKETENFNRAKKEKDNRERFERELSEEKKRSVKKDEQIKREKEQNLLLEQKHKDEQEIFWNELEKISAELTDYKNAEKKLKSEVEYYKQKSLIEKAEEDSVWNELEKVSLELQIYKEKEAKLRVEMGKLIKDINDKQESKVGKYGDKYFVINGVKFKMVAVNAGRNIKYIKRDRYSWEDAYDKRCIAISENFMCGETLVTQSLWYAVMGNNPSYFKGDNRPVEQVSWDDCQQFIANLNKKTGLQFRLLTESEWEFTARGGIWCNNYDYSGGCMAKDYARFNDNSLNETHEVKTRKPNALGIYDMSGNVHEWCEDWYEDWEPSFDYIDHVGPKLGHHKVCRGGAFNSKETHCRIEHRENWSPSVRFNFVGFRLAMSTAK